MLVLVLALSACSSSRSLHRSSAILGSTIVMPVRGILPWELTPNFGVARDGGARPHDGLDIMAPEGREALACVSGVMQIMRWNALGGNAIWLKGDDGMSYYYGHLSAYREGMSEGTHVMAAEVIGYVGSTGDAQGKAPHLHFEVHTEKGSPAIDPYPVLHQDGVLVMPMLDAPEAAKKVGKRKP